MKLSLGLTKILIGWLRISPKDSGILSENGTAGTGFEGFELRISSIGKPPKSKSFLHFNRPIFGIG